jgi:hypothetical protein
MAMPTVGAFARETISSIRDASGTLGDLHDVGIGLPHGLGSRLEVIRHLLILMKADDALRGAELGPGDLPCDVGLDIDVIHAHHDCLAQQSLALFLVPFPQSPVDPAPYRKDQGRRTISQDSFQIGIAPEAVDPQLDELRTRRGRGLPLGLQGGMSTTADRDANHGRKGEHKEGIELR